MSKPNKVYGGIEWTPANIVTVIRILFIPVFVIALLVPWEQCLFRTDPMGLTVRAVVSLVVFGLICLTDTLDGYLARSRNEVTVFGKFIDPIADKILVVAALLCLVQLGLLSSWVPIVIVAREMLVSGLRMLVASAGVVVSASILGKIKTATTMVAICLFILMVSPIVAALTWFRVLAWALMLVAVFFTIASMVDYFAKAWPLLAAAPAKAEGEEKAEKTSNELAFAWGTVEGDHPLAREVLAGLTEKGLSVCTAESCTGGLVCAALTSQPGSSSVVRVKVVKNKVAAPFRQAEFDILYGEGISKEGCVLDMAVDENIVNKSGSWYTYGQERIGQGREAAKDFLKQNPELCSEIDHKVRVAIGLLPNEDAPVGEPVENA